MRNQTYLQPTCQLRAIYDVVRAENTGLYNLYTNSNELTLGGTATFGDATLFAGYSELNADDTAVGEPSNSNVQLIQTHDVMAQ